jgi:hypothetical protein
MSDMGMLFNQMSEDEMDGDVVKKKGPTNRINDLDYSKEFFSLVRCTNLC